MRVTAEQRATIRIEAELSLYEAQAICAAWKRVNNGVTGSISATMDNFVRTIDGSMLRAQNQIIYDDDEDD